MASPVTVTREEAAAQAAELQPKPPPAAEAPRRAAPGSHPASPVESDMEALAQYQGADQLPGGGNEVGCWKLDAWNRPVFVPGEPASSSGGGSSRRSLTEPNEIPDPPEEKGQPGEKQPGRQQDEKPGAAREAGQRGR